MAESESHIAPAAAAAAAAMDEEIAAKKAKRATAEEDAAAELNRSRRQSRRSYSERRSFFAEQFEAQPSTDHTEVYKQIDESLSDADRLTALIKVVMEQSLQQVAESSEGKKFTGFKAHAEKVGQAFLSSITADKMVEQATEKPKLKPNPVNDAMRKDLKAFQALRDKLLAEETAWEQALNDTSRHLANMAPVACDTGAGSLPSWLPAARAAELSTAIDAALLSASAEDAVPQSDARTKLEVQVAALEAAVSVLNRLAEGAAQYAADQQARIAAGAFAAYADMNDPAKLIRDITKAGPVDD